MGRKNKQIFYSKSYKTCFCGYKGGERAMNLHLKLSHKEEKFDSVPKERNRDFCIYCKKESCSHLH